MADTAADRVLLAQLAGVAKHLAWSRPSTSEHWVAAVEELRQAANGRADLLTELGGVSLGVGESQLDSDVYRLISDMCVAAGADESQIGHWVQVGRVRAAQAKIPIPGALGH